MPVGKRYSTEAPFFNDFTAFLNFDETSLFESGPIFLMRGAKKMYDALLIAESIGSRSKRGSSSRKALTSGYVLAISALSAIAILTDSSISETLFPLMAIEHANRYPSVLKPYTATGE